MPIADAWHNVASKRFVAATYKFTAAFENSMAVDYVTEKVRGICITVITVRVCWCQLVAVDYVTEKVRGICITYLYMFGVNW